jgi:hypothetical protein
MLLTFDILKASLPELNSRRYTAEDFWQVTTQKRCEVYERKLKKKGYYATNGREHYIFLKHRLRELAWLEAAFHEMIHLLVHHPCHFLKRRHQTEASAFALIAMFPEKDLPELVSQWDQLDEFTHFLLYKRLQILERYGI